MRLDKIVQKEIACKTNVSYDLGMFSIEHLQVRLQNAKSVREVAKRSGLSEKTLHRIKSGNLNTSIATANKLAAALDALAPVKTRRTKPATTGLEGRSKGDKGATP